MDVAADWWQKQHIRDIPPILYSGDPIRNNAPWNIPYRAEQFPARKSTPLYARARGSTFLTVSVLWRSVSSLRQDFQLGSQGVRAPSGWVSFYTVGTRARAYAYTHGTPVMLGRFRPAASQRSALEFLRPEEISNWVMDMVTWTMRRQRREELRGKTWRERVREGERRRDVWNTISVHYLSPLPMTDLGFSVPKQTYLGIKKELWGVSQGQLNYNMFSETDLRLQRVQGTSFIRWELLHIMCHLLIHALYALAEKLL